MSSNDAGVAVTDEHEAAVSDVAEPDLEADGLDDEADAAPLRSRKKAFQIALVLAAVAFAAAILFGVLWWSSASGDDAEVAQARDEAVAAATGAIGAFTQYDFKKPDEYTNNQLAVSTSDWQKQIKPNTKAIRDFIVKNKLVATTKVLGIGVEELNAHEGKASIIAAIEAHLVQGKESGDKKIRVEMQMTRVGDEWKVAGFEQVPIVRPNAGN